MFSTLRKNSTTTATRSYKRITSKCLTYLVACAAISNFAFARSGTNEIEHVFSLNVVQVDNSEQKIIGTIECTTSEFRSCLVLTTSGERYLDQSELNWLFKYGGPH
jgi:hypothetical protein